jgi:hypothetical protein
LTDGPRTNTDNGGNSTSSATVIGGNISAWFDAVGPTCTMVFGDGGGARSHADCALFFFLMSRGRPLRRIIAIYIGPNTLAQSLLRAGQGCNVLAAALSESRMLKLDRY